LPGGRQSWKRNEQGRTAKRSGKSAAKLKTGEKIRLTETALEALSGAFFGETEIRFVSPKGRG
jgi:hypothetical protein